MYFKIKYKNLNQTLKSLDESIISYEQLNKTFLRRRVIFLNLSFCEDQTSNHFLQLFTCFLEKKNASETVFGFKI